MILRKRLHKLSRGSVLEYIVKLIHVISVGFLRKPTRVKLKTEKKKKKKKNLEGTRIFLEGTRFFLSKEQEYFSKGREFFSNEREYFSKERDFFLKGTRIFLEGTRFFSWTNENISRRIEIFSRTNENISRRNEIFFSKEREYFSKERESPYWLIMGKMMSPLFLIRYFLYLQVTRTFIKPRTSLNFGQIGPLTTELAALRYKKIPIDL